MLNNYAIGIRKDLEQAGLSIPAYTDVTDSQTVWLFADDLKGVIAIENTIDESDPHYAYEKVRLVDGREFYVHTVDFDYTLKTGE